MTKTKKIAMFAIPMLAVLMIGSAVAPAFAGVPPPGPAVVGMDQGCGLFDGEGNIVAADSDHTVLKNNGKGSAKLTCHAEGVVNTTGKAVQFDFASTGALCNILGAGFTDDWKNVVSDNGDGTGDSTLQCRIK